MIQYFFNKTTNNFRVSQGEARKLVFRGTHASSRSLHGRPSTPTIVEYYKYQMTLLIYVNSVLIFHAHVVDCIWYIVCCEI